jgi:FRG domain-containing protein
MPPTLTEKEVTSISDYMGFVEGQTDTRWYRGSGDSSHTLTPSLYRHPKLKDAASLFKHEFEILKRFKQRSIPYLSSPLKENDDLSSLFLMQHFGVPTRLLDWTENPYIALYFALSDAIYEKTSTGPVYKADAAIWVLSPIAWNGKALDFDPPVGIVSPPQEEVLNGYQPAETVAYRKPEPIALYGLHNSPRIVAQRGMFTLFGTNIRPMEEAYINNNYPQDCLVKLIIEKGRVGTLLESLLRIGITDSVVYPDLPGLAKEIKREFGFWV